MGSGAALGAAALQACGLGRNTGPGPAAPGSAARDGTQAMTPTPACATEADSQPTAAQTEGPYFTPDSPERSNFREGGAEGVPLVVSGLVYSTDCRPVPEALIDVWHADAGGEYDNRGYRMRGHFFTDAEGRYRLETIVPGRYPGRTRHLHVKVQAPRGRVLTTQLYFPDEPANSRDRIFQPELTMALSDLPGGQQAEFNFVVQA